MKALSFLKNRVPTLSVGALFFCLLCLSTVVAGCRKKKTEIGSFGIPTVDSTFSMATFDINALVSDSGLTQYRLKTAVWYIYDRAPSPYWLFPKGLQVEQLDYNLKPTTEISADSGYYDRGNQIWQLWGHISIQNTRGEKFFAPTLTWNRQDSSFFCPDTVLIITPERTLRGRNFRSNETFTRYSFSDNRGSALIDDSAQPNTQPLSPTTSSPTSPTPKISPTLTAPSTTLTPHLSPSIVPPPKQPSAPET